MNARLQRVWLALQLALAALIFRELARHGWTPAAALATAAAAPVLLHASIIGSHFFATRRMPQDALPSPPGLCGPPVPAPAPLAAGALLRMVLVETADSIRTFDWLQPVRTHAPLAQPRTPGAVPVLLLHGYLCNRAMWRPFARFLAARGHPVEAITLEPAFGSIDDYADPIASGVQALRRRTGAAKVALVGHSMGGLALRAYVRRHGTEAVAAAITLGTPHAGTLRAQAAVGLNARQMRLHSDWLRALAASESAATRRLFTVVLTRHDNIVAPQRIQTLQGAHTIALERIGHLSLAFDRDVMRRVADRLATVS